MGCTATHLNSLSCTVDMLKGHSANEKEKPVATISSKGFYVHHLTG